MTIDSSSVEPKAAPPAPSSAAPISPEAMTGPDAGDQQRERRAEREPGGGAGDGAHHSAHARPLTLVGGDASRVLAGGEHHDAVPGDAGLLELGGGALGVGALREHSGHGLHAQYLLSAS